MSITSARRPIRPDPEELRGMPTLDAMTAESGTDDWRERVLELCPDLRLELKLVTPDEKYWLCTQGITDPSVGGPEDWIVGNVTIEFPDGEMMPYSPGDLKKLQALDYQNMLRKELERLIDLNEREPSPETRTKIESVRSEYEALLPEDIRRAGIEFRESMEERRREQAREEWDE
jgi:hypothetical protein